MDSAVEMHVIALVTYRPCSFCGHNVPIAAALPGGRLVRSHANGQVSCSSSCRAKTADRKKRRAHA